MARVTVEDCVEKVESRFELVALAAQRAKAIASGAAITIDRDNDKDSVVALREIAQETIKASDLRNVLLQSFQKPTETEEEILVEKEVGMDAKALKASSAFLEETKKKAPAAGDDEVDEIFEEETEAGLSKSDADLAGAEDSMSFEEENLDVQD